MLTNCLNDLINRLEEFDIQTCKINITYREQYNFKNEAYTELTVKLTELNDSHFDIGMIDPQIYDLANENGISYELSTKLIQANLKITELKKLTMFVFEFKDLNKNTTEKFPKAQTSWWEYFKYKYILQKPNCIYEIKDYRYRKKESNAK